MDFAKISQAPHGTYFCTEASNISMDILGHFLIRDERMRGPGSSFKEWALNSRPDYDVVTSNCTMVEREGSYIFLTDEYSAEAVPTRLCMTLTQFTQLLDEWHSKVVTTEPKNIIIKHEHDQFFIETSND